MKWQLGSVALVLLAACGLVYGGGEGKKDSEALQGAWTGEKGEKGKVDLKFSGNKFTLTFAEKATFTGTFKVDASKKPRQIDMTVDDGPHKEFIGKTAQGIFVIEGSTLKWAATEPGKEGRPDAFPEKAGELEKGGMYLILKRAK